MTVYGGPDEIFGNKRKAPKGLRAREADSQEDLDIFLPKEASAVWKGSAQGVKKLERFPQPSANVNTTSGKPAKLQEEEVVHQTIKVPFLPLSTDSACTLGCIHASYANWAQLTSDRFILNIIQHGITIDFINTVPSCSNPRPHCHVSIVQQEALTGEINHLLSCGILSEAFYISDRYVSSIFDTEKPDLSIRLILNLKRFNVFVHHIHFKMESLRDVLSLIQPGVWMGSVDLKDASSVLDHPFYRKFFTFYWQGRFYEYQRLPNGYYSGSIPVHKTPEATLCYATEARVVVGGLLR